MLVTELLGASLWVSQALIARDEDVTLNGALEHLAKELISAGDSRAWRVREESVAIYRGGVDRVTMTTEWRAVWSPRIARFAGGEYDGHEINVRRSQENGLPPEILRLPYRAAVNFSPNAHPVVTENPSYKRAGTHPIDDVWIYKII